MRLNLYATCSLIAYGVPAARLAMTSEADLDAVTQSYADEYAYNLS